MSKKTKQPPAPAIVRLRDGLDRWRKTRTTRKPMPEELWREATMVARVHGVYAVCRETHLNFNALKARLRSAPAPALRAESDFVELKVPVVQGPTQLRGVEVELVRADGDKMIVHLPGADAAEVTALVRAFWSRGR